MFFCLITDVILVIKFLTFSSSFQVGIMIETVFLIITTKKPNPWFLQELGRCAIEGRVRTSWDNLDNYYIPIPYETRLCKEGDCGYGWASTTHHILWDIHVCSQEAEYDAGVFEKDTVVANIFINRYVLSSITSIPRIRSNPRYRIIFSCFLKILNASAYGSDPWAIMT